MRISFLAFIEIAKLNTREMFCSQQIVKLNTRKMYFFSNRKTKYPRNSIPLRYFCMFHCLFYSVTFNESKEKFGIVL